MDAVLYRIGNFPSLKTASPCGQLRERIRLHMIWWRKLECGRQVMTCLALRWSTFWLHRLMAVVGRRMATHEWQTHDEKWWEGISQILALLRTPESLCSLPDEVCCKWPTIVCVDFLPPQRSASCRNCILHWWFLCWRHDMLCGRPRSRSCYSSLSTSAWLLYIEYMRILVPWPREILAYQIVILQKALCLFTAPGFKHVTNRWTDRRKSYLNSAAFTIMLATNENA